MNRYKATTRLYSGRSFNIMCRKDWLPSTHKVLNTFLLNGFMLTAYCFLISTAKGLPWRLFTTPTRIYLLTLEISSTLHLLSRQHLSLVFPYYWRSLLSSCKRPSLKRNLFLFGLQNNSVFKELFFIFYKYIISHFKPFFKFLWKYFFWRAVMDLNQRS